MVEIEGRRLRVAGIDWQTHPRVTGPSDGDPDAIILLKQSTSRIYELGAIAMGRASVHTRTNPTTESAPGFLVSDVIDIDPAYGLDASGVILVLDDFRPADPASLVGTFADILLPGGWTLWGEIAGVRDHGPTGSILLVNWTSRRTHPKAVRTSGHDAAVASRPFPRIDRSHVSPFGSPLPRLPDPGSRRPSPAGPPASPPRPPPAGVGQRRGDRVEVARDHLGLVIVAALDLPLDRPDAADLLQLDPGVAGGLVGRQAGFAELKEVAELTRGSISTGRR